jgi:acyl carrier protein
MSDIQAVKDRLIIFLKKFFKADKVEEDSNIFEMGYVNSLFAMQFVMFIEKEFCVTLEPADLDMENFSTINKMVDLIQKKKS